MTNKVHTSFDETVPPDRKAGEHVTLAGSNPKTDLMENNQKEDSLLILERYVHEVLETYSNVHRGSGHNSIITTRLFEQSREIILDYLGLDKDRYVVVFCTPGRANALKAQLEQGSYQIVSSKDLGIPLGVRALAVRKNALPKGAPFQTGGGTARLVSPEWVIWANAPDKFEAGTPAIVNTIALARALQLIKQYGDNAFKNLNNKNLTASEILQRDELEEFSGKNLLDELRQTLIGRNVVVETEEGTRPYINLDNAASTPTFDPVWKAVCHTWRQNERIHQEIVQEVRSVCAGFLGSPLTDYDVIFTSNTTEAINLAAGSFCKESEQDIEPVILNTILEHTSNDLPWRMIPGSSIIRLKVDDKGFVDLNELNSIMQEYNRDGQHGEKRISLVAVSGASNVLGVYNNLGEISRIVHQYGSRLLVDAAQLVAHRKVEMEKYGIDYLAFSAHKVYAPFGSGALVVRKDLLKFTPEEMELIRASGEENVAGIAALGKSLMLLHRIGMDLIRDEEQALTARALRGLSEIAGLKIYGMKDPDSSGFANKGGVIVFSLKNMWPDKLAKILAEKGGIGVRYGCHCAHLLVKHILSVPPFLEQFQGVMLRILPKITLPGVVRISIGIGNSAEEIDIFLNEVRKIAGRKSIISKGPQILL